MTNTTVQNLAGRLERVYIGLSISANAAVGLLGDRPVYVAHGNRYEGRDCLVRFDLRQRNSDDALNERAIRPIGNFITTDIPNGFSGLSRDKYVFTALWEERMEKQDFFPTMSEVNMYFDPGKAGGIPFFSHVINGVLGALLTPNGPIKIGTCIGYKGYVLNKLADSDRASRLLVADNERA